MKHQLFYEDIFKKLQQKQVKYLLIGGIAVNLYGIQRATGDIDILLSMTKENLSKFIKLAKELGLVPKMPVKAEDLADPAKLKKWQKEKNMQAFTFIDNDNPYMMIDIILQSALPFEKVYNKKKVVQAWGIDVMLASLDDLIEIKKRSGRKQDIADIEALKQVKDIK